MSNQSDPSFEIDIKPLFRDFDRESMLGRFDLHNYDDVYLWADRILQAVASGDMPCDLPWTQDKVFLFTTWVATGKQP